MTQRYGPPEPLGADHQLDEFECRSVEQTAWLHQHARQSGASGSTKVFVVTTDQDRHVVAYYAWCMASLATGDAPVRLAKGVGRYPQPIALLARLGVDVSHESRGLRVGLLQDVVFRLIGLGDEIGCRGLLVHCETAEARSFYQHLVPEFTSSPTDELHLVLLMKDLRRTFRA